MLNFFEGLLTWIFDSQTGFCTKGMVRIQNERSCNTGCSIYANENGAVSGILDMRLFGLPDSLRAVSGIMIVLVMNCSRNYTVDSPETLLTASQ